MLNDAVRLSKFELGVEITLDTDAAGYPTDGVAPGSVEPFGEGEQNASTVGLIVAKAVPWRNPPERVLATAPTTMAGGPPRQDVGSSAKFRRVTCGRGPRRVVREVCGSYG